MKRSTKAGSAPRAGRKAILYSGGTPKKVELTLPVATPTELLRMLKITPTARQRVERAIARAGLRRKTG